MHISTTQRPLPGEDFTNHDLVCLPVEIRFLTVAIRMMADSAGRGPLDLKKIRRAAFPKRDTRGWRPTLADIETWMLELDEIGWLYIYPTTHGDQFQITAPLPTLPKEPPSILQPSLNLPSDRGVSHFRPAAEGRGGERVSESAGASGREPAAPAPASTGVDPAPEPVNLRISPARFCPSHPGGPPPGVTCPDCGTARNRHGRHLELRGALQRAQAMDPVLRPFVLAPIEAEMRALEEADAAARIAGPPRGGIRAPADSVPVTLDAAGWGEPF